MTNSIDGPFSQSTALLLGGGTGLHVACFSSLPPPCRHSASRTATTTTWRPGFPDDGYSKNKILPVRMKRDSDDNIVVSIVDRFVDTATKPIPGVTPSLAIGYPVALIAATLVLPITSSALLAFFFCFYAYAGRRLILDDYFDEKSEYDEEDEEEDPRPRTDLLAFGAAIVSAGLLSPDGLTMGTASSDGGGIILGVLVGLGSVLLLLPDMSRGTPEEEKSESIEDELMSLWDRKLREKETRDDTE